MKENERPGWEWEGDEKSGFWVKIDNGARHSHKLPFFCPCCDKISGTIDDKYFVEYGVCAECYVMYVESREKPAIDLSKYKK